MRFDKQTIVWTGAIVAVVIGFFLVVTRPQLRRIRELTATMETERAEFNARRQGQEFLPALQQSVNALSVKVADFDAKIPQQESLGHFLESLARSAQAHHLRPDAIEPGAAIRGGAGLSPAGSAAEVAALPIALRVRGPFRDVYGLIQDIEQMPRLTQVERFKVEAVEDKPGSVSVEMHLRIFFRAAVDGGRAS